jgi:hypothetical protein
MQSVLNVNVVMLGVAVPFATAVIYTRKNVCDRKRRLDRGLQREGGGEASAAQSAKRRIPLRLVLLQIREHVGIVQGRKGED